MAPLLLKTTALTMAIIYSQAHQVALRTRLVQEGVTGKTLSVELTLATRWVSQRAVPT
jgi:hypothetical protein